MRILLVEDNDAVREAFKHTLELLSYTVYDARDGRDALSMVRGSQVAFDLVISDLVMPHMNALQLYEALEQERAGVKMLIVTGYPMPNAGMSLPIPQPHHIEHKYPAPGYDRTLSFDPFRHVP